MPMMPIDHTRGSSGIAPVPPVHRSQAGSLGLKPPGTEMSARPAQRRQKSPGRQITVREDGWIRRYGVLPDGTRILLAEEPEHERRDLPLPRREERVVAPPARDAHDPECSMKASGRTLKSLLENGSEPD